jgi:Tfp pilus assembly protein PilZ
VTLDSELRTADGPILHGQLMDLSSGGAFVRTARPLPIGTGLRLALSRGHQRNPLVLDAEVVRVGTHAEGRAPGVGLRFHRLTDLDEGLLRSLIDSRAPTPGDRSEPARSCYTGRPMLDLKAKLAAAGLVSRRRHRRRAQERKQKPPAVQADQRPEPPRPPQQKPKPAKAAAAEVRPRHPGPAQRQQGRGLRRDPPRRRPQRLDAAAAARRQPSPSTSPRPAASSPASPSSPRPRQPQSTASAGIIAFMSHHGLAHAWSPAPSPRPSPIFPLWLRAPSRATQARRRTPAREPAHARPVLSEPSPVALRAPVVACQSKSPVRRI